MTAHVALLGIEWANLKPKALSTLFVHVRALVLAEGLTGRADLIIYQLLAENYVKVS